MKQTTNKTMKPGSTSQEGGTFHETGPRGGTLKNGRTVHVGGGGKLPPTSKKGDSWKKED